MGGVETAWSTLVCRSLFVANVANFFTGQFFTEQPDREFFLHQAEEFGFDKDADGVYLSCNRRFERFFGAKKEDILGKTDYDFVAKELADRFRENDLKAMSRRDLITYEQLLTFADDGHEAWMETTKTPMYDYEGHLSVYSERGRGGIYPEVLPWMSLPQGKST